jgi:carnitine 3-dehydrogenase
VPGHIANRLQAAIWREAIHLVLEGVGTVEDVDKALCAGPGIRWALMGQHLIFHLGGGRGGMEYFLDHIGQKFTQLWEDMAPWTTIPAPAKPLLVEGVQDELRDRSLHDAEQWRDAKLVDLLKLLYRHQLANPDSPAVGRIS